MTKTLHGLTIPRKEIEVAKGVTFEVRGIGATDLMLLTVKHGAILSLLFGKVQTNREDGEPVSNEFIKKMLLDSAREFPDLAAVIIALASDSFDDEGIAVAKSLNLVVQVDALEAIFGLTFTSEAAVKKLLESLTRMALAASGAMTGVSVSPTGIGVSEEA